MRTKPLVSIITPTYNHEAYISQCIESVLSQTFYDWEQIIIDDGSIDRTPELIARYKDPRIIYIRQEHLGPFALDITYNKGLAQARGDLIAILEGDDYWPARKLEEQIPSFKSESIILSHGLHFITSPNGQVLTSPGHIPPDFVLCNDPIGSVTRHLLLGGGLSHSSTVIIRRSALETIGGFQSHATLACVDAPTFMALGLVGRFTYIKKVLGYHRYHPSCVSIGNWIRPEYWENWKRYAIDFYSQHRNRLETQDFTESDVERGLDILLFRSYLQRGRLALYQQNWNIARCAFSAALSSPLAKHKAVALIGLFSSMAKANLLELVWKSVRGYRMHDLFES